MSNYVLGVVAAITAIGILYGLGCDVARAIAERRQDKNKDLARLATFYAEIEEEEQRGFRTLGGGWRRG
jgi:hypothetical protein